MTWHDDYRARRLVDSAAHDGRERPRITLTSWGYNPETGQHDWPSHDSLDREKRERRRVAE